MTLDADLRRGAVAGEDGDVIAEGEDFFADAGEEQLGVAAGEVGAADAAGEEDIAAENSTTIAPAWVAPACIAPWRRANRAKAVP